MLIALALVGFWPSPVDQTLQGQIDRILQFLHRQGPGTWFDYTLVEASANVVLFIPLGFVAALAFREKPWWRISVLGLFTSGCIELGQLLFLHNRFASPSDLVANTVGASVGALLALFARKWQDVEALSQQPLDHRICCHK